MDQLWQKCYVQPSYKTCLHCCTSSGWFVGSWNDSFVFFFFLFEMQSIDYSVCSAAHAVYTLARRFCYVLETILFREWVFRFRDRDSGYNRVHYIQLSLPYILSGILWQCVHIHILHWSIWFDGHCFGRSKPKRFQAVISLVFLFWSTDQRHFQ